MSPAAQRVTEPAEELDEDRLIEDIARFQHDPLGYVMYAFPWGEGDLADSTGPRTWQHEELVWLGEQLRKGAMTEHEVIRAAYSSGHGVGKSTFVAWIVLWGLSTFEDTRIDVTANTGEQLAEKTWPEIQKWHRMAINSHWFTFTATSLFSTAGKHEKTWRADAATWSEHGSEAFAGRHNKGKRIIRIFDEASGIADIIWDVSEGTLTDEDTEIIWLALGNMTRTEGRFRETLRKNRHRWHGRTIDARKVEGTNKAQIEEWAQDHGVNSDFFKVRVRGMPPAASARQFISETIVDQAYGRHLRPNEYRWAPKVLAVEPAWTGGDETVIGLRQGLAFKILETMAKNDNDVFLANKIANYEDELEADAVFIDFGWGTGIYSVGQSLGRNWQLVKFAGDPDDEGCLNKRAEIWKLTRNWLRDGGAIPEDQKLREELLGPETVERLDGKIQLESKEHMRKRGLGSPNRADCLAISFGFPVAPKTEELRQQRQKVTRARTEYDPFNRAEALASARARTSYDPFGGG